MELNRSKEVELLVERKKLEDTLKIINDETINYIEKRKHIVNYIKEYRKKYIEEYRDDEDLLIQYFDHERYVKEESFKTIDKRLKEFVILKESPYFGRIIFSEDDDEFIENLYIGRFGLTPEGSFDPIVVDWRAPVASLFYSGKTGDTSYVAPAGKFNVDIKGRRQFIIKRSELQGMFDSALDIKDEVLQLVLSKNSSDKLKDIITTLQKEQDEIIRQDRRHTIVVNGVAGSGKTTVALHRVAYLLYTYRKELENKVLILGPNAIFMEYIREVLPSLGETPVNNYTFVEFALQEIEEDIKVMDFVSYMERVLNDDEDFVKDIKYKKSYEYKKKLDSIISNMTKTYFNIKPVKYMDNTIVSKDEIEELFTKHYEYMPLFKRSEKIERVLISKIKDKRDEKVRELNKEVEEYKKSLDKDSLLIEENNIDFERKLKIREIIKEVMRSKEELHNWIKNESAIDIYNRINDDKELTTDDLAPILYIMINLFGKKSKMDIKHVVIDEAQDYSLLQFEIIKKLTGAGSFTIVGDMHQRLINFDKDPDMLYLDDTFNGNVKAFNLNKSYRSTYEIMEYANKFLKEEKVIPIVRNGNEVLEKQSEDLNDAANKIHEGILKMQKEGLSSIAIITRDLKTTKELYSLLRAKNNIVKFDSENIIYKGGLVIIPSYFAKGLEFDGVIIYDDIIENKDNNFKNSDLIKYIMTTRALHSLMVVNK